MTVLMTTPFLVVLGGFAALVAGWTVYARAKHRGAHKAPRHDDAGYDDDWRRDRQAEAAAGEDAIAQTIAGAAAGGFLGAETIPIAPTKNDPPWALPGARSDTATVHVIWPGLERAEELVPLPDDEPFETDDEFIESVMPGLLAAGVPPEAFAVTRGVVVEPGWGEPDADEPGWAETTFPGLLDGLTSYAYPDGFPPRRDTTERYDLLFGTAPWTGGGDPASAARLDALVFELLKTPDLDADRVFALMGGNS